MDAASGALVGALAGAIIALGGSLGAQFISARAALRLKHAELLFAQKAKAYEALLASANEFNSEPKQSDRYVRLLTSLKAATLVAPSSLTTLLDSPRIRRRGRGDGLGQRREAAARANRDGQRLSGAFAGIRLRA